MPLRYDERDLGRYVSGEGNRSAYLLFCGEGPGASEDRIGRPFVGRSGRLLDTMLRKCLCLDRSEVFVTNLVRRRIPKDGDPTPELIRMFEPELIRELAEIEPAVVCSLGRFSTRWFLGDISMEVVHGIPHWSPKTGAVVLPAYHPAAGLRSTEIMGLVAWDFQQLRLLLDGKLEPVEIEDEYPNPEYKEEEASFLWMGCGPGGSFPITDAAVDTEGSAEKPWGYSYSLFPGTGTVVRSTGGDCGNSKGFVTPRSPWTRPLANGPAPLPFSFRHIVMHNALFDIAVLRNMGVGYESFDDTMLKAALLCVEPQGLKPLAKRLCGADQKEYAELVREPNRKLAMGWLEEAYAWLQREKESGE